MFYLKQAVVKCVLENGKFKVIEILPWSDKPKIYTIQKVEGDITLYQTPNVCFNNVTGLCQFSKNPNWDEQKVYIVDRYKVGV